MMQPGQFKLTLNELLHQQVPEIYSYDRVEMKVVQRVL